MNATQLTSKKTAKLIAGFAQERKADDIIVLDMHKAVNFCDYFVLCSGTSNRRIRAIADAIQENLEELGLAPYSKQGFKRANWIIIDCGDVVTHVFDSETRAFYDLERLWQDAEEINWKK